MKKISIALLESLPDSFFKKIDKTKYEIFDLSEYFKSYRTIKNYKTYSKKEFSLFKTNLKNISKIIQKVQIVIFRTHLIIDQYIINLFKNSFLFIRAGSGYDNINILEIKKRNLIFHALPEANKVSAAEHTIMLILALIKKLIIFENSIRSGKWRNNLPLNENIENKKILIIGFGNIGQQVARILKNFNANLYVYDPYIQYKNLNSNAYKKELSKSLNCIFIENLENNLDHDLVTLHVPLWDKTYKFISFNFIDKFKKPFYLINTSRGEVVDENAIINALKSFKIKGYAADVFSEEPVYTSKLFKFQNTIFTPHIGAYTKEAKNYLVNLILSTLEYYFKKLNGLSVDKQPYFFDQNYYRFYFSNYFKLEYMKFLN